MFAPIQPKTFRPAPVQRPPIPLKHPLGDMMGFILSPQVKTCRRCGGK